MTPRSSHPDHVGDGVYVTVDSFTGGILLYTDRDLGHDGAPRVEGHPVHPGQRRHWIVLEGSVLEALNEWAVRVGGEGGDDERHA